MATAAELVMAPSAARPETAGAHKDAPAAAGETSFAEILDGEVQATTEAETVSDPNAATTMQAVIAPQAQPALAPVSTSAVELLLSLQPADTTVAQPIAAAAETTLTTPAAPPAVASVVTPEIIAAEPAPAAPVPPPAIEQIEQTNVSSRMSVGIEPVQQAAAAVAAPVVVAAVSKAVQAVAADAQDKPEAETNGAAAEPSSTDSKTNAADADPAAVIATPAESSATISATAPAQVSIAMAAAPAPKPIATTTTQSNGEKSPKIQQAAGREATAADASAVSSKYAPPDPNASSASQTVTTGAVKPQTGVQTVAPDAVPNVKTDAPASPSISTSFADLMAARGAPAEAGKPATYPAMHSAPPAVAQVYTRFVERFDGRAQRFEVRLDPAELGRVDVRIEIGADKKVHAVLSAHDSAALSDLMRGQRALERALSDAGIDLKDGGLKFELANDSNRGLAGQEQRRDAWSGDELNVWRAFSTVDVPVEASANATIAANAYPWRPMRLDLVA